MRRDQQTAKPDQVRQRAHRDVLAGRAEHAPDGARPFLLVAVREVHASVVPDAEHGRQDDQVVERQQDAAERHRAEHPGQPEDERRHGDERPPERAERHEHQQKHEQKRHADHQRALVLHKLEHVGRHELGRSRVEGVAAGRRHLADQLGKPDRVAPVGHVAPGKHDHEVADGSLSRHEGPRQEGRDAVERDGLRRRRRRPEARDLAGRVGREEGVVEHLADVGQAGQLVLLRRRIGREALLKALDGQHQRVRRRELA